jgi:hypothetical protein
MKQILLQAYSSYAFTHSLLSISDFLSYVFVIHSNGDELERTVIGDQLAACRQMNCEAFRSEGEHVKILFVTVINNFCI